MWTQPPCLSTHHFTSLSLNVFMFVCTNHFAPDCFLNEGQFKAGFVKKLKLKDGPVPIVYYPAALPEEVSLTLYIFMIICESLLLFHRRGAGWAELISMQRDIEPKNQNFEKTLKNHINLWKMSIQCLLWSHHKPPQNQTYFKIIQVKYRYKIIRYSLWYCFWNQIFCIAMAGNTVI